MRNHVTYRSERRNAWREGTPNGIVPWPIYNGPAPKYHLGSVQNERVTMRSKKVGRSKYMPHQGKQEMARRVRPSPTLGS